MNMGFCFQFAHLSVLFLHEFRGFISTNHETEINHSNDVAQNLSVSCSCGLEENQLDI